MGIFGKRRVKEEPVVLQDEPGTIRREVHITVDPVRLLGDLLVPVEAKGIAVFAHGSGSSRLSPRNREVAERLNRDGIGTLLFDLLTPVEAEDRSKVFDVDLLAKRLLAVTKWIHTWPELRRLPLAFFGASTGAAAALTAAALLRDDAAAVVSRGGRPDLASDVLPHVSAPTLLIVGGDDTEVLDLNRQAESKLQCDKRLEVVPGAGHLFEEPGAMERVGDLAAAWFVRGFEAARERMRAPISSLAPEAGRQR